MDYVSFERPAEPDWVTFKFRLQSNASGEGLGDRLRDGLLPDANYVFDTRVVVSSPGALEDLDVKKVVSRTREFWRRAYVGFVFDDPSCRGDVAAFENRGHRLRLNGYYEGKDGYYGWDSGFASGGLPVAFRERVDENQRSPWYLLPENGVEQTPPREDFKKVGSSLANLAAE